MAFDNRNFSSALTNLLSKDFGRKSYFDVKFLTSMNTNGDIISKANFPRNLSLLCHNAELPGESLSVVRQKIYGVIEQFPLITHYSNITLSFYLTGSDYDEVRLSFLTWLTYITGRQETINVNGQRSSSTTYNVPYKDDITTRIEISHYSITGDLITKCWLIDAFPIQIGETPLSWADKDSAMSLNVVFAYTEYEYFFYGKDATEPNIPFFTSKSDSTIPITQISTTQIPQPTSTTNQTINPLPLSKII